MLTGIIISSTCMLTVHACIWMTSPIIFSFGAARSTKIIKYAKGTLPQVYRVHNPIICRVKANFPQCVFILQPVNPRSCFLRIDNGF